MKQPKEKTNIFHGSTLEEFWERTEAFHKKHNARRETRSEIEKRITELIPEGMVSTEEIDSALSYLHKKDENKNYENN